MKRIYVVKVEARREAPPLLNSLRWAKFIGVAANIGDASRKALRAVRGMNFYGGPRVTKIKDLGSRDF